MLECARIISFVPSNDTILYLNKPSIIRNGGELSDLEYLLAKTENVRYLQNAGTAPLVSFGLLYGIMEDLNKPKIIKIGGELIGLDYLPSKQKMQNISRTRTREPLVSWSPSNHTIIHFKRAFNDGE